MTDRVPTGVSKRRSTIFGRIARRQSARTRPVSNGSLKIRLPVDFGSDTTFAVVFVATFARTWGRSWTCPGRTWTCPTLWRAWLPQDQAWTQHHLDFGLRELGLNSFGGVVILPPLQVRVPQFKTKHIDPAPSSGHCDATDLSQLPRGMYGR